MKNDEIDEIMKDVRSYGKAMIILGENENGEAMGRDDILFVGQLLTKSISAAEDQLKELIK